MSDAWILLSVGDARGDQGWASLGELIAIADANNHAIPGREEVESAVSNLVAAGLVETDGMRTRLTPEGARAYENAWRRRVGHIERMLNLSREWEQAGYPPQVARTWSIPEDAYERACRAYAAEMDELLARILAEEGR